MSAPAAFEATFSLVRPVASRKALQIILEVPIEHQAHVLSVLGGMACYDGSVRVAVARLGETVSGDQHQRGETAAPPAGNRAEPHTERSRRPASIAFRVLSTCGSPSFQQFLEVDHGPIGELWRDILAGAGEAMPAPADHAEETVKAYCGVSRKRDIEGSPLAVSRWSEILATYEDWQRSQNVRAA